MRINCGIAAAILAYGAAAIPTKPQPSPPSLPSDPISLLALPVGTVKPVTPANFNATSDHPGDLEDFPTISDDRAGTLHPMMAIKDHGENRTSKPLFHPDGLGSQGPVIQTPRPTVPRNTTTGIHHPHPLFDIFGTHKENDTAIAKPNKTTETTPEDEEAFIAFYFSSRKDGKPGGCPAKAVQPREIFHEADEDHTILDECKIKTAEKNWKEANAIISQAKTEISSVHSDITTNSHKTIADAANELDGMVDLPPHLRDFYLDQLAKLNATSTNTFVNTTSSNTSLETYNKTDPKDATSSTDSQYHSLNISKVNSHDELAIDGHVPIDLSSKIHSETQIQPSSTFLLSTSSSTSSTVVTEAPSISETATFELVKAITTGESFESSSSVASSMESSIPLPTTLSTITTSAPQISTQSDGHQIGNIFTRFRHEPLTTPPSPTSTMVEASSTPPFPVPTSASIDNEGDGQEIPNSVIIGSDGQEIGPKQAQRRGQMAYVNEIQLLNKSHMEQVVDCKSNVTCISETNRKFAIALGELKV